MHAIIPDPVTLDGEPAEQIMGTAVTPGYFAVLGVHPRSAATSTASEETNGGAAVVILSDATLANTLWRESIRSSDGPYRSTASRSRSSV